MQNQTVVQTIYTLFGQGDVEGILSHISPSVEWEYGAQTTEIPWVHQGKGHEAVRTFFASMAAFELRTFQPKTFLESGPVVVVLIDVELVVKATGKTVKEEDEVHIWYFNEDRKIMRYRHQIDTLQHYRALQG